MKERQVGKPLTTCLLSWSEAHCSYTYKYNILQMSNELLTWLLSALVKIKAYSVSVFVFRICLFLTFLLIFILLILLLTVCCINEANCLFLMFSMIVKCGFRPNVVTFMTLIKGLNGKVMFVGEENLFYTYVRLNVVKQNRVKGGSFNGS